MNRITTQSLFSSSYEQPSWKSYLTSVAVHAGLVALLLAITVPMVQEVEVPIRTTLIAPVLPPKIEPYRIRAVKPSHIAPKLLVTKIVPPKPVSQPVIKPPVIEPQQPQIKPQIVAEIPKPLPPAPAVRQTPAVKFDSPIAANVPKPKPTEVHTGVFGGIERAKGPTVQNQVKTGGFGDPNGVRPQANAEPSTMTMAKLGSFDLPNGSGRGGANGAGQTGGVRDSGFGSVASGSGGTGSGNGHSAGPVKTGGFGDGTGGTSGVNVTSGGSVKTGGFVDSSSIPTNQASEQKARVTPAATPVEITFKPRPQYTPEARSMKLEGQVKLEVVFLATGSVRVIRVIQGLGHGLDQAAEQAAAQVRFRPATRDGTPVDTSATIYISFELT